MTDIGFQYNILLLKDLANEVQLLFICGSLGTRYYVTGMQPLLVLALISVIRPGVMIFYLKSCIF
jgi:hypothetical protein